MAKCTWVGQSELAYYNSGEAAKIVVNFQEKVDRFLYFLTSVRLSDMWSDAAIMRRRWSSTQSAFPLPNPNACSSYLYLVVRNTHFATDRRQSFWFSPSPSWSPRSSSQALYSLASAVTQSSMHFDFESADELSDKKMTSKQQQINSSARQKRKFEPPKAEFYQRIV